MPETGVKGLLKFIVNHPETREKTSISQLQQKVWTKTRKKPLLLCDYYAVITWILSRGDRLAIQRKRLSAYSLLFGGNFLCYSVMFRKLVESLQRLGVQLLFFVDSAPGSNEDEMRATFYELKERHLEELEQNHVIQQVCDGKRDILRVPWRLREAISIEVEMLLRSMAVPLIHCNGDADLSIVQYSRLHEEVCGVLSTDTIFATVPSIQLLHMDFFDPDNCLIVSAEDNMADSVMGPSSWPAFSGESDHFDITCEVTSAEMLAQVLGIGANQLVDLSILCGNSYTRELNRYMSTWALLGLADLGVETVAEWLSHETVPLPSNAVVKGICTQVPAYHEAITHSYRVYKGFGQPDMGHQATSFGVPASAMAGFAYWRPVVVEATTLGHPCISDLTLPIRKVWYALLGLKRVVEYGRVGNKTFAELVVTVGQDGAGPLHIVQGLSLRERIGCLFFVLTLGHHWLERGESLMTILSHSLGAGRTLKEPISCQGILVCTSLRLMAELNSKGQPSPSIRISELEALIVACLLCCAGVPPCHTTSLPSMRAITIASWFTSIMEHAYHTAYLLCLLGELPSPSRCFYSLAYVPFHVATVNQNHSNPTSDVGPNLLEAQRIFGHVINLPSALTLRSFILNKSHQYELQHVLDIFAVAVREVSENRSVLTPREGLNMTLPIEMGYEFDGKVQGESAELLDEQATDSSLTHDQDSHIESYCFESLSGLHDSEILSDEEEVASITNAEAPQEAIRHKCPSLPDENEQTAASACTSPVGKKRRKGAVRLPVMDHRESITELVGKYRVTCIQGETGCGKSTKVPQFILDDALSATPPKACKILVSQPRRVAAIKLAERVAAERHESLGRTVGFAVAGEKKRGADTAIIYCTTGYLLQMLIHDPFRIEEYTHIILDEIHERNIDADFAMLVVRKLVSDMPHVKVVLMSATMQVDLIVRYFQEVFGRLEVSVPYFVGSKLFPVETFFLDELGVLAEKRKSCDTWHPSQMKAATVMKVLVAEANRYAMPLHCKPEVTDYMRNLCTEIIVSQATLGESILVFLPGMGDIVTYFERLSGELRDRELLEHFSLFMLHSQIPLQEQREAFVVPPANKVHLILATNIAESSVTVPKLTLVINFGIYRQLEYNSKRHITCLSHRWCSHASCSQRAGRVGRVCAGTAVHLVTREFYNAVFPEHDLAAMATAPLSKLVLQAKQIGSKVGVPSVTQLLSLAVEPPSLQQLEAALQDLVCMGAIGSAPGVEISEDAPITLLGQMSLSLPVELPLSRLVFLGVLFGCVCDAVVLAAALSLDQDVFTLPSRLVMEDRKYHASLLRSMEWREYYDGSSYSEPIAVYRMFRQFLHFKADAPRKKGMSRCAYTRLFSQNVAVRYDRLLQLESVVGDISNRMLGHVERDSTARGELSKLALLVFSHPGGNVHSMPRFCDDPDFLKALLITSFCHQTVFGVTECNSCFKKERAHAVELFGTIKELGLDYTRTLAFKNLHNVTQLDLDTAARHILPQHHCQTLVTKKTGFIQVNESFDSNPKTKLLRSVAAGLQSQEGVDASVVSGDGVWRCGGVVVSRPISSELRLLWQYGERHITWKARPDDAAELTRPAHPCNVAWYRMNVEKERVIPGSWRNVAGFVCELDPCETPFFAVPFMLQGTCNGPSMAAKGLTVLPSLKHSPRALRMLLSSQPLGTGVDLLVDKAHGEVVGARVNSCLVMFEHHKLTPTDMLKINLLRMLISSVVSTVSSEAVIPGDKATAISWVVQDLLSGTLDLCHALKELPQTENYEPAAQALEPMWEVASSKPSDTAVLPAAPLEGCPPQKKVFELFPPLSCSLVKQSTLNEACSLLLQSVGSTSGEAHQGVLEPTVVCTQDPGVSFRLSPSAPPFTPIFTHGNSAVQCDPSVLSVPAVTSPIPSSSSFPKLPVFSCVNSESPPAAHEVKRLLLSPPPASTHFHHSTPPPPVPLRASPGFHTSVPFPPVVSNPFQLPRSTPTSPLLPCGGVCTEADRVAILQKVLELRALQTYWSQQQPNPASPSRHTSSPLLLNPHIAEVQAAMRLFASLPQLAAAACPAVPPSPNGSQPPARPRASGVYPSPSQVTPQQALQQWLRSSQPVGGMPMVSPQQRQDWDPSDAQPASVPASPVWSGNQRPSSQGDVSDNLDRSLSAESSQNLSPCSSVSTGSPRLAASQLEEPRLVKFMMDYIASHGNCVNFDQLCKDAYPSFKRKYSIANDELALTWHFFVRHPKIFAVFGYPGYCMVQLLVRHSSGGSVTEPTLLEPTSSEVISLEPTSSEVISLEPASSEVTSLEPTSSEVTSLEPASSEVTLLEPTSSEVTSLEPASSEVTLLEPASSEVISLEPTSSEVTSLEPASSEVISLEPTSSEVISLEPTSSEVTSLEPASSEVISLEPASSEVTLLEPTSSEVISLEPTSSEVISLEPTSSEVISLELSSSEVISLEPASSEVTSLEPASSEVTLLEPTSSEVTLLEPTSSEVTSLEPASSEVTLLEPTSSEVISLEPASSEAPLVNKSGVMNCWPQGTVRLMEEEEQCIEKEVQLVQEEQSEEVQLVQEEQSEEVQLVQEEQSEEVQLVQEEQSEEVQLVQEEQSEEVQLVQEEQSEEVQLVQEEQSEEVQLVQEEQSEEVQLVQEEHYEEQARTTWEEEVLPLQVVSNCTKKDFQLSQVLISTDVDERCPVVHDFCESNKVLLASDITMTAAQPCLQETGVGTFEADYLSPEINNICMALETRDTEMESAQKEFTQEVQKGVVMETSGVRDVVRGSEGDAAEAAAGACVGESPGCVDPILLNSELRFLTRSPNLMELQALLHSISISSDYVSSVSSAQASTPDLAAGDGLGTCVPPTDSLDSFNWEGDVFSEVGHPAWAKSFTGPPPPTDLLDMSLGEEWFDFSSFIASSDAHHSLSSPTAMRPCSMPPSCLVDAAERSEVGTLLERSTGSVGSVETYTAITTAGEGRFDEDEVFKTDSSVFDPYTGVTSADNAGVATTDTYTTSDKAGVATTPSAGEVIQHCTSQSSNMADLQEHTSAILCVPHTTVQTKKNLDPPTGSALSNTAVHSPVDVVSRSQYNSISHGAQPVHSSPPYSGPEHQSILTAAAGFWLEQGATSNTNFGPQEMAERGMPVSGTDQQAAAPDAKESPVRAEIVEGSPGMSVGPSGACSEKTSGAGGCSLPRRALVPYHLLDRQKRLQPGTISHKTSYLVDYLIFQGGGAHMNQISQVFHENYVPMVKSFSRVSVKFFQDIQEYFIVYEVRGGHFVRLRTLSYAPDASVIMEVKKCGFIAAVCHALAYEEEGLTLSKLKRMPLLMQSLMSLGADMSQLLKACPDFFTVSGSVDGNCCFMLTPRAAKAQREFLPRDRRSLGGTHRDKKPQSAMQVASSFVLSCKAVPVPVAATDACGEKRSVKSGMPLEDGMDEENCKEKPKVLCDKVPLGDHGKDGDGKVSKERSVLEWTVCKDVPRKGRYWKDRGRRDRDGKDKGGRDRDGKDRGGMDIDGKDRGGRDRDGKDSGGRDRDGKDRGGRDRGGKRSEEQSVPKSTDMPCDKEDEKRPKERSSTGKKVTFQIDTKK